MPGVFDIFLLNGTEQRRARFLSAQCGQELSTDHSTWAHGAEHIEALGQFFDLLRRAPTTDTEVELESAGQALSAPEAERAGASTEDIFRARYQRAEETRTLSARINFSTTSSPRTLTCSLAAIRKSGSSSASSTPRAAHPARRVGHRQDLPHPRRAAAAAVAGETCRCTCAPCKSRHGPSRRQWCASWG